MTIEREGNRRRKGHRKRKGIEKIIMLGNQVSTKCGNLILNQWGSQCRYERERLFRKVVNSVDGNNCSVLLDNRITK